MLPFRLFTIHTRLKPDEVVEVLSEHVIRPSNLAEQEVAAVLACCPETIVWAGKLPLIGPYREGVPIIVRNLRPVAGGTDVDIRLCLDLREALVLLFLVTFVPVLFVGRLDTYKLLFVLAVPVFVGFCLSFGMIRNGRNAERFFRSKLPERGAPEEGPYRTAAPANMGDANA